MAKKALFSGLIFDEDNQVVEVSYVGSDPCYVVDDAGFKRHIPAEDVDRQVLNQMLDQIKGNEELFTEQTAKILGQEDLFTVAMIKNQLLNIDKQIDQIFESGIPEEGRAYMGMMGFRIVINYHGEIVEVSQPGAISDDE